MAMTTVHRLDTPLKKVAIFVMGLLLAQSAVAGIRCVDAAKPQSDAQMRAANYLGMAANLRTAVARFYIGPTERQKYEQIYILATSANHALDSVVQDIVLEDHGDLSEADASALSVGINYLLQAMSETIRVPTAILRNACERRASLVETNTKNPIGFHLPFSSNDRAVTPLSPQPIGFGSREVSKTSYGREELHVESVRDPGPLGFGRSQTADDKPAAPIPIGFGSRSFNDDVKRLDVEFNQRTGVFDLIPR